MKNATIILFFILFHFTGLAQPSIEWQKCLGGTTGEIPCTVTQTFDGGYAVFGMCGDSSNGDVTGTHGSSDFWIAKLSPLGSLQWQKSLGGSKDEWSTSMQQTTDSGYILGGYTKSNDGDVSGNHGFFDYWVVKLSSSGAIQWQKCYGGSGDDHANSVKQTFDGGYIVAGISNSTDGDVTGVTYPNNFWVVKLSSAGAVQWQKSMGGDGGGEAHSIIQTADSGYVVAGVTASNNGDVFGNHGLNDFWVVKLSPSGSIQWEKCYGGTGSDVAYSIIQSVDGGYVAVGYSNSNDGDVSGNDGNYDAWVLKISGTGGIQWQHSYGGSPGNPAYSVFQTGDGGYVIGGFSFSCLSDTAWTAADARIIRLSASGDMIWLKCLGGSDNDEIYSVQQTSDQGYIMAAYTLSNDRDISGNHGSADFWVVKLAAPSGIIAPSVNAPISILPNPTSGLISIQGVENADIKIHNTLGQLIKEEKNTNTISIAECPPGIFFISIFNQQGQLLKQDKIVRQ